MTVAQSLIDKAIEICGSAAEVARKLGIDRAEITRLKKGQRPLSPELAAEIADIAGEDARQAVIDAVIERNADSRKGPLLRDILGKAQAAGGAAVCHISYSEGSQNAMETIAETSTINRRAIHRIKSNRYQFGNTASGCR